jgi:hypothetical protein
MEMTMTDKTLPPLSLDDIRVAEPDRDSEAEFMPEETWTQACHWQDGAIDKGYAPAAVAAILLDLPGDELDELRDWWAGECDSVAQEGQGRDALCHDLLLCRALDALHPDGWPLPMIDPATVLDLLDERDALQAENAKLRALLLEMVPGGIGSAAWPGYLARVLAALGTTADAVVAERLGGAR